MTLRAETFIILFMDKFVGALWGIAGYRLYQEGNGFGIVLCIGAAAAFTYWRTNWVVAEWRTR